MDLTSIQNPVFSRSDNLRDPAVLQIGDTWHLYYTRFSNDDWYQRENWSVARVITRDWIDFEDDKDITPKGFASPGDIIQWHGRWILPYESYPLHPSGLFFSTSTDCSTWDTPQQFLIQGWELPWNTYKRAIDPTLVVHGDTMYCYFTASVKSQYSGKRANAIGLAKTTDPDLQKWEIISSEQPLLGPSPQYPDGVENLTIVPDRKNGWTMFYSAGLKNQRIARMKSNDLILWTDPQPLSLEDQWWCSNVQGAPGVFTTSTGQRLMIIMGSDDSRKTRFGLAAEDRNGNWSMIESKDRESIKKTTDLPF